MNVHYFQHVPFEGLGYLEEWLLQQNVRLTTTRFFEADPSPPSPPETDFLIVLGGPMSVHDTPRYPWLKTEVDLIRRNLEYGTPILGICLGAQLIAAALGSRILPQAAKEIGWFPITGYASNGFAFPESQIVFHWHGESLELPPGAVRLARSTACQNQAFSIGSRVLGLQFHLESTPESVRSLVHHCRHELTSGGPYVQSEAEILAAPPERYSAIHACLFGLLDAWLGAGDRS